MTRRTSIACVLALATGATAAHAQSGGPYEIVAWTIDGGGLHNAVGGPFALSGTIGQPDAGPGLSGGPFEVAGGFWPAAIAADACPADLNNDGQLNFFDVAAYIALFNAGDPAADFAPPFGELNFFDLAAYIALFNAGCP